MCVDDNATHMNNTDAGSVAAAGHFTVCILSAGKRVHSRQKSGRRNIFSPGISVYILSVSLIRNNNVIILKI